MLRRIKKIVCARRPAHGHLKFVVSGKPKHAATAHTDSRYLPSIVSGVELVQCLHKIFYARVEGAEKGVEKGRGQKKAPQ
jgi:hypothetical protein